jgi:hypothetical protein
MRYVKYSTMALAVLFTASCSSQERPPPDKKASEDLTRPVERARAVQKTVDDGAEKVRKEIDAQERGDKPSP